MSDLTREQRRRVEALGVAHRMLAGKSGANVMATPAHNPISTTAVPAAVRLAEYVLTGRLSTTETPAPTLETPAPTLDPQALARAIQSRLAEHDRTMGKSR